MKKLVTLVLAVALVLAMATTAFAAVPTFEPQEVTANISNSQYNTSKVVYSVDVNWNGLTFEYTTGGMDWDPSDLKYDDIKAGSWSDAEGTVVVTNKTNAAITAAIEFDTVDGIDAEIKVGEEEVSSFDLASAAPAEATGTGVATSNTFTITVSGTPDMTGATAALGTITVTITDAQ